MKNKNLFVGIALLVMFIVPSKGNSQQLLDTLKLESIVKKSVNKTTILGVTITVQKNNEK